MKYQIEYNITLPVLSGPIEAESEDEAIRVWRDQRRAEALNRVDPGSIRVVEADPDWQYNKGKDGA